MADSVLIPLQCEYLALEGLSQLLFNIQKIKQHFNPSLQLHGVVLTMYDKRNRLSRQVADDVGYYLGGFLYETIIPRNVKVSEAPSHGKPVLIYDVECTGSKAYLRLAGELLRREGVKKLA